MAHRLHESQSKYRVHQPIESGKQFRSLNSAEQVWNAIESQGDHVLSRDVFGAIRRCAALYDTVMCWRLFEYARSKALVNVDILYQMVWIMNHCKSHQNSQSVMQTYYALRQEMSSLHMQPNFHWVTSSLSLFSKYGEWNEAHFMFNQLRASKSDLLQNCQVWNAYLDTNIKQSLMTTGDNIDKMTHILSVFEEMHSNSYRTQPNYITHAMLISAISKLLKRQMKFDAHHPTDSTTTTCTSISQKQQQLIEVGEQLFAKFSTHQEKDPAGNVYAAMIDLYGNIGNTEKCMQYLEIAIAKQFDKLKVDKTHKVWSDTQRNGYYYPQEFEFDERTIRSCIGGTIKSVINAGNKQTLTFAQGWKLIDYVSQELLVKKCKLPLDVVAYAQLVHCCSAFGPQYTDMKTIKKLYKQMIADGVKPNGLLLNNIAVAGKVKYEYEQNREKADKLAKWIIRQFDKHQIPIAKVLQSRLNNMMAFHDYDMKTIIDRSKFI